MSTYEEEYIPTSRDFELIDAFQHGSCHVFAMLLSKRYGFPIECCWDLEAEFHGPEGVKYATALIHAYCVRPDNSLVDASGTITRNEVEGDFGDCNVPSWRRHTIQEIQALIDDDVLSKPTPEEIDSANELFAKFEDYYLIDNDTIA